ncbi:hypothetical protein FJZ53_06520 [Candidatus Woesearchaeota archaeon]|nr:hypothetical protein [Candidatus Woesearchaeota archaeon]
MKQENISVWVKSGILRLRQVDTEKIRSMITSAEVNARVAKSIALDKNSATLIFREIYESIRQLGDAAWWLQGYEPTNHEISVEILKEMEIKEKLKLNFLDRFKKIRHDANYRGFIVTIHQAEEIIDFWNKCGKDIINNLSSRMKKN